MVQQICPIALASILSSALVTATHGEATEKDRTTVLITPCAGKFSLMVFTDFTEGASLVYHHAGLSYMGAIDMLGDQLKEEHNPED